MTKKPSSVCKKPNIANNLPKKPNIAKNPPKTKKPIKARANTNETLQEFILRLNSLPEPDVRRPKQSDFSLPHTLLMGSACSGIETTTMATEEIDDKAYKLKFWVEKDKNCQKFLRNNFSADIEYDDVFSDAFLQSAPFTHGFTAGSPCQPFSSLGQGCGIRDTRSHVIAALVHHVEARAPRFFILENVVGLAVRHRKTLEATITTLCNAFTPYGDSYRVQMAVLSSTDFQVPQHRSRIFIMGY